MKYGVMENEAHSKVSAVKSIEINGFVASWWIHKEDERGKSEINIHDEKELSRAELW
jgi:hypothetical protein